MALTNLYDDVTSRLRAGGDYVWPLLLRLIMFWEFYESGKEKLNGNNWFSHIQDNFPFPFNQLSANLNWIAATYGELIFAFMLLFGLFTRFAAVSLVVITAVATAAVHWPAEWNSLSELWQGYAITDKGFGNFKLPLLFVLMLLPLVFQGGGKLSLDHLLLKVTGRNGEIHQRICDMTAAGLTLLVLGLVFIFLIPAVGITLAVLGLIAVALPRFMS